MCRWKGNVYNMVRAYMTVSGAGSMLFMKWLLILLGKCSYKTDKIETYYKAYWYWFKLHLLRKGNWIFFRGQIIPLTSNQKTGFSFTEDKSESRKTENMHWLEVAVGRAWNGTKNVVCSECYCIIKWLEHPLHSSQKDCSFLSDIGVTGSCLEHVCVYSLD